MRYTSNSIFKVKLEISEKMLNPFRSYLDQLKGDYECIFDVNRREVIFEFGYLRE